MIPYFCFFLVKMGGLDKPTGGPAATPACPRSPLGREGWQGGCMEGGEGYVITSGLRPGGRVGPCIQAAGLLRSLGLWALGSSYQPT